MKIKILKQQAENLEFEIEGITPAFANALRRIMITEVPTMAVESVEFHENGSSMFDEMIAHRIGLLPLVFPPEKMKTAGDCECKGKGCPLCTAVFFLEKTGPCMIHSGDMKSSNKNVSPTYKSFPIVELLGSQRIKLEAIARLGIGLEHAKWQAANSSYQYHPDLFIDAEVKKKHPADLKSDPKYIIDKITEGTIKLKKNPDKFIFRVESVSGLKPGYIVMKSAQILEERAEEFKKHMNKI